MLHCCRPPEWSGSDTHATRGATQTAPDPACVQVRRRFVLRRGDVDARHGVRRRSRHRLGRRPAWYRSRPTPMAVECSRPSSRRRTAPCNAMRRVHRGRHEKRSRPLGWGHGQQSRVGLASKKSDNSGRSAGRVPRTSLGTGPANSRRPKMPTGWRGNHAHEDAEMGAPGCGDGLLGGDGSGGSGERCGHHSDLRGGCLRRRGRYRVRTAACPVRRHSGADPDREPGGLPVH